MFGSISQGKSGSWIFNYGKPTLSDGSKNPSHRIKIFYVGTEGSTQAAKSAAEAYQKSLQPELKKLSTRGKSVFDGYYKTNKKFRDFVAKFAENTGQAEYKNFYELSNRDGKKNALWTSFQKSKKFNKKPGYNTSLAQLAEKLGVPSSRIVNATNTERFGKYINDNFKKIKATEPGKKGIVSIYKDPTDTQIKNFKEAFADGRKVISEKVVKRIKEIDKVFRDTIVTNKTLPKVSEVIANTSANTPTEAATAMSAYSKALRGVGVSKFDPVQGLKQDLGVKENIVAGERLLIQFGQGKRNEYANEFYKTALKNIDDKNYGGKGTLKNFRKRFNDALRLEMGLASNAKLPFNVNEVISISAGESRGIQPFSVFVDATNAKINSGELARYQSSFSRKVGQVEDLIKADKMDEATKLAATLKDTQATTASKLLEKGFNQKQINQLNFPEIVVGNKIDPKIYSPENLARYKEAGVDIEGFAKDRKFYVDTKGTKPFFEVSDQALRAAAVKLAKNNTGDICDLVTQNVAGGGRIGFAKGGNCATQVAAKFDENPVKFAQDVNKLPESSGAINKVKSAASKFLNFAKTDFNLMGKYGKFGAVAGLGAAAAGVKEFFSDDPTSYLSNEKQQKNLLIDMVTEPIAEPTEKPAILEAQMPVLGAALVAGTIPGAKDTYLDAITGRGPKGPAGSGLPANIVNKPVGRFRAALGINKGVLGKGLAAIGTPAGMLATEPFFIGNQIAEGDSIGEIATNPMNYLGAAFASPLTKMATKNVSPTMANIMRLGLSPARLAMLSRFGQFGLAAGLGIAGVNLFNDYRNSEGFFEKDNVGPARFDQEKGIGGINFD